LALLTISLVVEEACHAATRSLSSAAGDLTSWEGFHGGWPMVIVQQLRKQLPPGYVAEPRVHLGSQAEIDVAAFEKAIGQPLPTLPLWLSADHFVPLDLEPSYEQACHDLWIT
jgi:hypothetical protein